MSTRAQSDGGVAASKASPARNTTYSVSLNGKSNFKDLDMSMTVDIEDTTAHATTIAESSQDLTEQLIEMSLDETDTNALVDLEAEGCLPDESSAVENEVQENSGIEIGATVAYESYVIDESDYFQYALVELGRRLWKSTLDNQRYTKGCLWSPDGTCILVPVHLDGMHVMELPQDLYKLNKDETVSTTRNVSALNTAVHVREGGTVYECVWYPFMNSNTPATCCWLASRQHEPIHMWDAFTGELRCTYRGYDNVDEVESAISMIFSNDGEKVIGGYKKSIKLFDTNIPGRDTFSIPVKQAVSCFALTTDNDNTVTTGSWNGYINHYDLRVPKLGPLFTLGGHTGGITWLRYAALSISTDWTLFSGARMDNKILEWDMRNYTQPTRTYTRKVTTNQRIYFDLSPHEQRWLVSGSTDGNLHIWGIQNEAEEVLPLHDDCCNGASFHPKFPILATSSGKHHCVSTSDQEDSPKTQKEAEDIVVNYENSLMLWWIGKSPVDEVEINISE
ncbi:telomerase Cajal body protein 1 homolog [Eurosta solidaginis]|uniref:telomerase Cajal body protein 1 homolog n=1 Tax=Eurosta solidaginis TaxID=178769 RepID=UPI003531693E